MSQIIPSFMDKGRVPSIMNYAKAIFNDEIILNLVKHCSILHGYI